MSLRTFPALGLTLALLPFVGRGAGPGVGPGLDPGPRPQGVDQSLAPLPDPTAPVQEELEFTGSPAEAMERVRELSRGEEPQRAFAIAAQFAADVGLEESLRAEFHFAGGVVRHDSGMLPQSIESFRSARALAGPGELRNDATYDAGTARLGLAELQFERARDPASAGPPDPDGEPVDWLLVAESSYLRAKESLVERLRADWRDPDTRANLELIQRRLRQIAEMREQEEQEQNQQEPDPDSEDQEGEGEGDGSPQNPEEDQQPDQQPEGGDQEGDPSQELPEEQPDAALDPDEMPEPQEVETGGGDAERRLSREEVLRLLETLEELDEEAAQVQALLRESRREPVEKDW